jgi:hypothetical protein
MYTMANLPQEMQNRVVSQMNRMPIGINIGYRDEVFPMMYGPNVRAMKAMYSPQGAIANDTQPSGMSSAMSAMAPYMYMIANQIKNQNGSGFDPGMPSNYNPNQSWPYFD